MILNLIVIVFLIVMCVLWAQYGLFSALIHLIATIVAGTLAFALWEPITYGMLMGFTPKFAWGIGLLLPFVVLLVGIRTALDKLVKANMEFSNTVNMVGGGFFGLLTGILTSGFTIIGLGFLPLGTAIAGHQPYEVAGGAAQRSSLLIAVDRMASGFFSRLSSGSMSSDTKMADYLPDVAHQAELYRFHYDENATLSAVPSNVTLMEEEYFVASLPVDGLDSEVAEVLAVAVGRALGKIGDPDQLAKGPDGSPPDVDANLRRLVMINMRLAADGDTILPPYDGDQRLRVVASQARLLSTTTSRRRRQTKTHEHVPVGMVYKDERSGHRLFIPVDSFDALLESDRLEQRIAWVFVIGEEMTPRYLMFRRLRYKLPRADAASKDAVAVGRALGKIGDPDQLAKGPDGSPPNEQHGVDSGQESVEIAATAALPYTIYPEKAHETLEFTTGRLEWGEGKAWPLSGGGSRRENPVRVIGPPGGKGCVRIRLTREAVHKYLGRIKATARALRAAEVTDSLNAPYKPFGYVLQKASENELRIHILESGTFKEASDLPISQVKHKDVFYLYFAVPDNVSIVSYQVGRKIWEVDPPLEVKPLGEPE
ncbi:MAG: hypothetical protein CMJ18_02840 [Phycisphaeraceae bacterium]|nr:hypothetical protein [Phycisphaeraceae bacterium]